MRCRLSLVYAASALALFASACGSNEGQADSEAAPAGGDGGNNAKPALTITEPKEGASVQVPFTLKYTVSGTEIGPEETGKDHVHVVLDDQEQDYTVVPSTNYEITGLPAGQHKVSVTLQHADHSDAGARAEVTVNVTGGDTGGDTGGGDTGGGGYDY